MSYTLSNALVDLYAELGLLNVHVATGGTVNTEAIDANYTDDGDAEGYIIVIEDAAGAGAAPEGQYQRVSAFSETTGTFTTSAFTGTIAVGDIFAYVNNRYPLNTMVEVAINPALRSLGYIDLTDVSVVTVANQTEYTLPTAAKHGPPKKVEIQTTTGDSNDNRWVDVPGWYITPSAPGSTALLVLPQYEAGSTVKIWYQAVHPRVNSYADVISETIPPELLTAMARVKALQWKRSRSTGTAYVEQLNAAKQDLINTRALHKIYSYPKYSKLADYSREAEDVGEPNKVRMEFEW